MTHKKMLTGWAHFGEQNIFLQLIFAETGGGPIFKLGVFSRHYGNLYLCYSYQRRYDKRVPLLSWQV